MAENEKSQPIGKDMGVISKHELLKTAGDAGAAGKERKAVKAVMFVPEGTSPTDVDLDIQVVSIKASGLTAIASRRC